MTRHGAVMARSCNNMVGADVMAMLWMYLLAVEVISIDQYAYQHDLCFDGHNRELFSEEMIPQLTDGFKTPTTLRSEVRIGPCQNPSDTRTWCRKICSLCRNDGEINETT